MADWEQQFDDLIEARGSSLSAYAYLLTGDRTTAADLLQESLLRVFTRLRLRDDIDELEAYTRRAILHLYLDERRRQHRWQATKHLLATPTTRPPVDEAILDSDAILGAFATLSPRQRVCVVLRFYHDLSVPAIARELGCGDGTVKRHLNDAKTRLAAQLRSTEENV